MGGDSEAREKDMRSRGGYDNAWKRRDKRERKDKEIEKVSESVEERERSVMKVKKRSVNAGKERRGSKGK